MSARLQFYGRYKVLATVLAHLSVGSQRNFFARREPSRFTPGCRNSDKMERLGSITKEGSRLVRCLLAQAVLHLLHGIKPHGPGISGSNAVAARTWRRVAVKRSGFKPVALTAIRNRTSAKRGKS